MFAGRPDTWADFEKSIPKAAQVLVRESIAARESVMHEAFGRDISAAPAFRSEVAHANPFPLACVLTDRTAFTTQDQLPLKAAPTSRGDGDV